MSTSDALQGPPKAINRTGTRFTPTAVPGAATPSSTDDSPSIASLGGSEAPGQDYSILATPSFTPGEQESPFITWGDLQGTPLRLDPEDDVEVDPAAASGPQFSIREVCRLSCIAQVNAASGKGRPANWELCSIRASGGGGVHDFQHGNCG